MIYMAKKKLEVVELNKKEEKIVLEEKQSSLTLFLRKYRLLLFITALIISLTVIIISLFIFVKNIYENKTPVIENSSLSTTLTDYTSNVSAGDRSFTESDAKNRFKNNNKFKSSGEVLVVKVVNAEEYTVKFYSDKTALMINKKDNSIIRINPLENGEYAIDEYGVINTLAKTSSISLINTKKYPWGTVSYFSDGSAEITASKMNMFVRDAKDIKEDYISNNKVSYLKETKEIDKIKLNYYYDGTIEIIKNNKSYLVRNEKDLNITKNDVTFKNNNAMEILTSKKMDDGKIIDYYKDGGAIIRDGSKTLSVRKSNSIIIKDNKIFEIVDNIYVTIANRLNDDSIIYYTNGGATIKENNKTFYISENSNIKYNNNNQIKDIEKRKENLTRESTIEGEHLQIFEDTAIIETKDYIAIVPSSGIVVDSDGKIKDLINDDQEDNEFTVTNNSDKALKYRIVIEQSPKTNLEVKYIRYQLQIKEKYYEPQKLDNKIWRKDKLSEKLSLTNTNYILIEDTIEPFDTINVRLMLWTDYETIPNSMQDKYFYGTIRIYAWTEE